MTAGQSVFQAVAAVAARHPGRTALSGAGRQWSYAELIEEAEQLACALHHSGFRHDTTIAAVAGNHPRMAVVWLAAARVGATISLVNFMLRAEELAALLRNLQPALLFCDAARLQVCRNALRLAGLDIPCVLLDEPHTAGEQRSVAQMLTGERHQGAHPLPGDAHEISYTSGTTSAPKGAVLTHAAVLHRAGQEVALFKLVPEDAALIVTPLFHQSGIRDGVLLMWLVGGHAVITPKFDAATFWPQVRQHGISYCCMVETMLLLLERNPASDCERDHTLRRVLGNGHPDVLERLEARFGLRFVTVYGMTENGVPIAVPLDFDAAQLPALRRWRPGAFLAGWPQAGTELRLVGDDGIVSAAGISGEIQIRSKNLLREYHRDPDATQAALADGWFRTGDMGLYGPGGALYFVDRIRDVIRRGGENIASMEVEGVIAAHPAVQTVAVVPVPDPLFQQELKAVVVARTDAGLTPEELWRWCDDRLARYKVPRYLEFRDTLPVSGTGRIQKQILRAEGIAGRGRTFDRRQEPANA